MGNWVLTVSTPVETDNLGTVTTDSNTFNSSLTLNVGTEMLVAAFDKSVEVEQYNGVPFLGEIPVLRYLFGAESKVKSKFKVFVTLTATPVVTKNSPGCRDCRSHEIMQELELNHEIFKIPFYLPLRSSRDRSVCRFC